MIILNRRTVTGLVIVALFALSFSQSTLHALPNQIWVGSALSGTWESIPETPPGFVEVQIDVRPTVLNLQSQGLYTVFLTFPEGYDYGKEIEEIGGETIILQFNTHDLDVEGFESGDDLILLVKGTLIDGTSFWGSISVSYADGHVKIIRNFFPYPTDP